MHNKVGDYPPKAHQFAIIISGDSESAILVSPLQFVRACFIFCVPAGGDIKRKVLILVRKLLAQCDRHLYYLRCLTVCVIVLF